MYRLRNAGRVIVPGSGHSGLGHEIIYSAQRTGF